MINRIARGLTASLLSFSLLCMTAPQAMACAPDLAYAVLINGNHPDLPLGLFAQGDVGIVQSGWAKSYLIVAYRYLIDKPLTITEQETIINLWHKRIINGSRFSTMAGVDQRDAYIKLRAQAIQLDPKKSSDLYYKMDGFCYKNNIGDSAVEQARSTLQSILSTYKPGSAPVREWVAAQDGLFGIGSGSIVVPPPLPSGTEQMLVDYRTYQIGAANYYLSDFVKALICFQKISASSAPDLKQVAPYMVLRTKAAEVRLKKADEDGSVSKLLQEAAQHAGKASDREDYLDLLRPIDYMNESSVDAIKMLTIAVTNGTTRRFGGDVGDLTFLLDGNPLHAEVEAGSRPQSELSNASDLADWILNVQNSNSFYDDDSPEAKAKQKEFREIAAKHSLDMWRKKHSLPWLVAALTNNGLRNSENLDLYEAAKRVSSNSVAYLTCRFYIGDALIAANKKAATRHMLAQVFAIRNMPPSARNIFRMQMAAASDSIAEYLQYSVQTPPEILQSSTDLVTPKFLKVEANHSYLTETPAFDTNVAADVSRNAPLSTWMALTVNKFIPSKFRAIVLRAAWTRAILLQRDDLALQISDALAATNPVLSSAVAKFKNAGAGLPRQFASACLVLRNFGMSPYLLGGDERHGAAINQFDWYNNNFWIPFPLKQDNKSDDETSWNYNVTVGYSGSKEFQKLINGYDQNGLNTRLSAIEKKQASAERALLLKNHPSRFFGQIVLDWARLHPSDPDVPEMLYKIVRLPKWTDASAVGSEYSRKAYLVLHSRYQGNKWTKKAVCYY